MIGIVIVSHSKALAEALVALVRPMARADVRIAAAAGVGEGRAELGTDAAQIVEAVQAVYSPDGVVVLVDLGSAVLSAETALDFLPEGMKSSVRICPAPVVEGTVVAAVQASLGSSLDVVCQEAIKALEAKVEQMNPPGAASHPEPQAEAGTILASPEKERVFQLKNVHGLHARPAAKFVQTAARFDADILVRNQTQGKGPASARSLNALALLAAVQNDQIVITARGVQAGEALEALARLMEEIAGEDTADREAADQKVRSVPAQNIHAGEEGAAGGKTEAAAAAQALLSGDAYRVIPLSGGIAVGPLAFFQSPVVVEPGEETADPEHPQDPQAGWDALLQALETTRQAIAARRDRVAGLAGSQEASIFDAHLLILEDPDLLERVRGRIYQERRGPAAAWDSAIQETAQAYRALPDAYLRQRAADVLDVGSQVLSALAGAPASERISLAEPSILFVTDLTPTQTVQLDLTQVLGIVTAAGGPTAHSAILARALEIPAVTGMDAELLAALQSLPEGTPLALDGFNGGLWIRPSKVVLAALETARAAWQTRRAGQKEASRQPAVTRDGKRVAVFANLGSLAEARSAVEHGAEGSGLLRTEFLFLTRETPPDEDEQVDALKQIGAAMGERPLIVRTLDVGGDKALPYLRQPAEANPFLGVRAIRLSMREPGLFRTQLRAVLRAGTHYHLRVMFPMISGVGEVDWARQQLEQAHAELSAADIPHRWPVETGIMVEIPSAALLASALAGRVDFFSIGTNDLTQYTLAAERGSPALADYADGLHPAVLRLIQFVVQAAHERGKSVGVCGELASDPQAIPVLVGLGVDELSMQLAGIPEAKAVIRELEFARTQALAEACLRLESAQQVREVVETVYPIS